MNEIIQCSHCGDYFALHQKACPACKTKSPVFASDETIEKANLWAEIERPKKASKPPKAPKIIPQDTILPILGKNGAILRYALHDGKGGVVEASKRSTLESILEERNRE